MRFLITGINDELMQMTKGMLINQDIERNKILGIETGDFDIKSEEDVANAIDAFKPSVMYYCGDFNHFKVVFDSLSEIQKRASISLFYICDDENYQQLRNYLEIAQYIGINIISINELIKKEVLVLN